MIFNIFIIATTLPLRHYLEEFFYLVLEKHMQIRKIFYFKKKGTGAGVVGLECENCIFCFLLSLL
jgi:hypothetical protein